MRNGSQSEGGIAVHHSLRSSAVLINKDYSSGYSLEYGTNFTGITGETIPSKELDPPRGAGPGLLKAGPEPVEESVHVDGGGDAANGSGRRTLGYHHGAAQRAFPHDREGQLDPFK